MKTLYMYSHKFNSGSRTKLASILFAVCLLVACGGSSKGVVDNSADTESKRSRGASQKTVYLSDIVWASATNGWGPVERDTSNGEDKSGDGLPMRVGGVAYAKGLGANSESSIKYDLAGECNRFTAVVGLDDEIRLQKQYGSISFVVLLDGVEKFNSGVMRLNDSTMSKVVNVSVAGGKSLELKIVNADEAAYDHGDWADAKLQCNTAFSPVEFVSTPSSTPPNSFAKKLIEFGWDNPRSDFVRQNITEMEKRPFSGFTMLLSVGTNIFNKAAYSENDFADDRANLKATKFTTLTENFIRMDTRIEEGWNWLNDNDWNAALENVRQTTRTAKVGNFKGIIFDTEPYGISPWKYSPAAYGGKSYAEVSAKVRQRGRDFITVVHQEMPGAKILTTWFLSVIKRQLASENSSLEKNSWALLVPFVEGWMDNAQGEKFIDGVENSYFTMAESDFKADREAFATASSLLSPENQAKYSSLISISNGAYIDGILNNYYRSPRFVGHYFKSDAERMQILESNAYYGLKGADEYVWVYSERMNWWTGNLPAGVETVYRNAVTKINTGQPLGIDVTEIADRTRKEYNDRIFIRGKVTKNNKGLYLSASVNSGFTDIDGNESACQIYSAEGDFTCQLPYGWKGKLTPTLNGVKFEPGSRDYASLNVGPGAWIEDQDFEGK